MFSAFLVALFTEMYGFPLTIYLLSGWLGQHFPSIDFLARLRSSAGDDVRLAHQPALRPFHLLSTVFIGGGFWRLTHCWQVSLLT